jgi:SAM-dependent methyltransferase
MPLSYYSRAASPEFWAEHWGVHSVPSLLSIARRSPLTTLIETGLPRSGRILEAGCGLGQYVLLLRERGRAAVGVDWSLEALSRCRKSSPTAPVGAMDLTALGIKSGAVAAYLSLGVVEHDPAGPGRILSEAHRVLAPGGRLIVSVPYLNGVRRLLRPYLTWRQARVREQGGQFYQYAFTRQEVQSLLESAGFRVLSSAPYDPARLLRKATRWLSRKRTPGDGAEGSDADRDRSPILRLAKVVLYTPPFLRLLGHMILFVAVKR